MAEKFVRMLSAAVQGTLAHGMSAPPPNNAESGRVMNHGGPAAWRSTWQLSGKSARSSS